MTKILDYLKTHKIGAILSLVLFLLVFILPKTAGDNAALLKVYQLAIFALLFAYLGYRFILFRKENPNFKATESQLLISAGGSIIAIFVGLLFGLLLMLIVNPGQAFPGFLTIIVGGFDSFKSIGSMIYLSVPIILTGLAVAFAFRTGLFNIGATGQLTMGAFVAVFIGVKGGALGDISPFLHWGTAVLAAAIVGGIWGAIPGLLKAYRNVNEVVSAIMLNYVAMFLNTLLITSFIYNADYARALDIKVTAVTPTLQLDYLFPGSSINAGIIVAVIIVIVLHIILNKTTFGYELKAVGFNRDAAKYAGINARRNIVISMLISGAVAGVAGGLMFLVQGKYLQPINSLLGEGFTGIAISLLGLNSPFGVLLAGLFYGSLQQGGYYLQLYDFNSDIIDIIIAVIIYASALGLFLQQFIIRGFKKVENKRDQKNLPETVEGSDE